MSKLVTAINFQDDINFHLEKGVLILSPFELKRIQPLNSKTSKISASFLFKPVGLYKS